MIIDCHCHAGKGDKMTAPWNTDAPMGAYLRRARAAGIDKTVVLAPLHGDYRRANAQVAQIVARYPDRLIGFAFVHTKRDAGRIFRMVKHAVTRWNFRGIKVHGFEAMPTREVCETAQAFRLPMLVDVISRPEVIDMFAPEYPKVNFIIEHGGKTDFSPANDFEKAAPLWRLASHPNLYMKITPQVYTKKRKLDENRAIFTKLFSVLGAQRLAWGSNFPASEGTLTEILQDMKDSVAHLPQSDQEWILGKTALKLYPVLAK